MNFVFPLCGKTNSRAHFCPNFQIFCLFLSFFWKTTCMPLISRLGSEQWFFLKKKLTDCKQTFASSQFFKCLEDRLIVRRFCWSWLAQECHDFVLGTSHSTWWWSGFKVYQHWQRLSILATNDYKMYRNILFKHS